jgi:homoserine O-succinyltransferase
MPVRVDSSYSSHDRQEGTSLVTRNPPWQLPEQSGEHVTIGLINSMPAAAFKATESQFLSLLDYASEGIPIRLSLYTLPGTSMTGVNGDHASSYSSVDALWDTHLDGLIVTGTEPMTPALKDEPRWESITKVLEWARDNTHSTVWSCLAAHAAVLHMDGLERRRNHAKHFGVFDCHRVSDHWLMEGAAPRFQIPHSRWHGVVEEEELAAHGYSVLTRTADAGVDTFIKQENSLFVFFQGHPEYGSDTLLREYRRDVGRYLRNDAKTYPPVPRGYFDGESEEALSSLREKASSLRSDEVLAGVATVLEKIQIENTWQPTAVRIYRNWLKYICACKEASRSTGRVDIPPVLFS